MSHRILVTGSRNWTDRRAIHEAILGHLRTHPDTSQGGNPQQVTIVHGGARGADTLAGSVAAEWGMRVEVHRADWDRYGKSAGHRRNAEMVAAGADVCLAFPIGESRGTRGCIALAEKAGIPVVVHAADGVDAWTRPSRHHEQQETA